TTPPRKVWRAAHVTPARFAGWASATPASPIRRRMRPSRENAEVKVDLSRDYAFEAAHRLPKVPADHKCYRVHGHSYRIQVTISGEVDRALGWLVDFADITAVVEPVLRNELDHRVLNDVAGLENATSENLAAWLWRRLRPALPGLSAITVHETCTARCTYR